MEEVGCRLRSDEPCLTAVTEGPGWEAVAEALGPVEGALLCTRVVEAWLGETQCRCTGVSHQESPMQHGTGWPTLVDSCRVGKGDADTTFSGSVNTLLIALGTAEKSPFPLPAFTF
ncbi:hypothetical protein NDU88_007626 [Pleurodeles waltl]|uniref:Uncharacterized protein n=1 Tax=Pleurodeles waltl TaxID=8319 RepID=A0AAV7PMG2_PLEWA|nr:hypothetical protein NDU88_007626 [Pleurodeles waltl]